MVIAMTIVNVGVSHRFAPAELLEKLAVSSTCNRVEVYAAASGPAGQVTRAVAGLVAARGRLPVGEVLRMARTRVGGAAAEHLFSVACGLDSMAVGEDQIVAQVKDAARAAAAAGTTGPAITGLIDAALRASKRARTQTTISTEGISLARAGLDLAAGRLGGIAATPVIAAMHAQIRQLADAELARLQHRLPDLSEQQRAETAATVHRILRKVLHRPTVRAKEFSTGPDGPLYLDALKQLFDLRTVDILPHLKAGDSSCYADWS